VQKQESKSTLEMAAIADRVVRLIEAEKCTVLETFLILQTALEKVRGASINMFMDEHGGRSK